MDAALAWRRRAFLVCGIPALLLTLSVDSAASLFDQGSDPNIITIAAVIFMAVDLMVLNELIFSPPRVRKMRERLRDRGRSATLVEMGKALSFLAASLIGTPIVLGLVLVSISGDAWRLYVFVPISLIGGIVLWRRIEDSLRQLEPTGLTDVSG